jgi:predicted nucleic acid-binding protein
MIVVVADTSPLIALLNIRHAEVLPTLFVQVIIPPAVASELAAPARPQVVRDFVAAPPVWLRIRRPAMIEEIPDLHPGEREALSLAIELHADLVLIDERKAYREAVHRKLNAIGTIRILERAAAEGLLDLKDAFARLKQTDFWISHKLLDERLKLFEQQGPQRAE